MQVRSIRVSGTYYQESIGSMGLSMLSYGIGAVLYSYFKGQIAIQKLSLLFNIILGGAGLLHEALTSICPVSLQ